MRALKIYPVGYDLCLNVLKYRFCNMPSLQNIYLNILVLYTEASTNPAQELNSSSTTVTQTSQSTTPNVAPKLRNDISFCT